MALKAVLDSLDDVNEALRGEYREGTADEGLEGKFVLSVESVGGYALEDVGGLKTALGKERSQRERLERDVVKFKDIDPDKARDALQELEAIKAIDPTKEADKIANTKFEAAKAQLLEKHTGEVTGLNDRIKHLSGTVESLLVDQVATAALAEAKGSVDLLLPHVQRHTRVKEEDGRFKVEVVDADGNSRIADAKGTPMGIKDLIAEMKASETFGRAFDASGNSGSGMTPGGGGSHTAKKGDFGGSREDRRAAIASRFPDLAKAGCGDRLRRRRRDLEHRDLERQGADRDHDAGGLHLRPLAQGLHVGHQHRRQVPGRHRPRHCGQLGQGCHVDQAHRRRHLRRRCHGRLRHTGAAYGPSLPLPGGSA